MMTLRTPFRWLVLLLIGGLFITACTTQTETSTSTDNANQNDSAPLSGTENEESNESSTTLDQPEPTNLPSSTVREIIDDPDELQPEPTHLPSSTVREIIDDPDAPQPVDDPNAGVGVAGPGESAGMIEGGLSFPSDSIPPLDIYAISITDPNVFYQITTEENQNTFRFEGLAPDEYYLLAYPGVGDDSLVGGYTQAVVCGLTAECTDHSLIPVSDGNTAGIEISDWYAPPGTFPARPGGEPQPIDGPMPLPDADFQELLLHFIQPIEPVSLTEANDQLEVCGSVLVPVSYVVTTNEPVMVALEELLVRDPIDLDLENYLFGANIIIANIEITNRHAMIWLEGDVKRADPCDDLRVYRQLEETALSFPYIDSVELFANGALLEVELSPGVGVAGPGIEAGVIEGGLSFPAQGIPALDIYAISVADPNVFYQITTEANQMSFRFEGLAPGEYYLLAYLHMDDNPLVGGYTQAVVCGLTAECTDHSLIPVLDGNTTGIEISDWYAPPGVFPTRPTGTPQPLG